jgi:hypothetical protein
MPRGLRYADAVTLLGGSGPLIRAADRALGTVLTLATAGGSDVAISLFDAKSEAVKLGEAAIGKLAERVRGLTRYDRSARLQAAHGVLVVTALFEALDSSLAAAGVEAPVFTRDDQLMLAAGRDGDWPARLLDADLPVPAPDRDAEQLVRDLTTFETTLLRVSSHRDPARHRSALAAAYRAALGRPVLGGDENEVAVPSLGAAYIDPRFRVKAAGPGARPADDGWWDTAVRADFGDFLATYLTTPESARAPMLLLGQPGAGKSSLTRILAARLPAADYLVVRVVLREVRAEAEVQDQIEQAVRSAIGETVAWADLARDADRALPLILLDGFDELLQATGVHQSDYLQRVAEFQHREAGLGRPVAVLVTSRVAVADRARLPTGGLAVRLEPFDEPQLIRWREIWNAANPGRRPLPMAVLHRFRALAEQPLLLLMLALYDASGDALRSADDDAELDTGQLYERLLGEFARREVSRVYPGRPESETPRLVEQELLRLSVVAFAMFHRGRFWVTEAELDNDLAGLGLQTARPAAADGFRTPLTAGQEMVGRFFFIQRAQALRDDKTLQTYEFLHATFGEYLVARLTVQALRDAVARDAAGTLALQPNRGDSDLLQELLGYTALTSRTTVLPFVTALLGATDRAPLRAWLIERLRAAVLRPQWTPRAYQPVERRIDFWMATYSFNLALLVLACGEPLRASELWQYAADPAYWMRVTARQWTAAIPTSIWLDSLGSIGIDRAWTGDRRRDIVLTAPGTRTRSVVDPLWAHSVHPDDPAPPTLTGFSDDTSFELALRSMSLDGYLGTDLLRHALDPILATMPAAVTEIVVHSPGDAESIARSLLNLWLASLGSDDAQLAAAYDRAVAAVASARAPRPAARLVLSSLQRDAPRLPAPAVAEWVNRISGAREHNGVSLTFSGSEVLSLAHPDPDAGDVV